MTRLLAIDPGNRESGWCIIDTPTCRPVEFGKTPNDGIITWLRAYALVLDHVVIEQIGHYGTGMPAGRDVFDTCRWIGRFEQTLIDGLVTPELVLRATVKTHLCGTAKAKDSNVRQALVDRFAPGVSNYGKGTKAEPGWFYGFRADVWQAMALAVYAADRLKGGRHD